jgi:hypothetical protein
LTNSESLENLKNVEIRESKLLLKVDMYSSQVNSMEESLEACKNDLINKNQELMKLNEREQILRIELDDLKRIMCENKSLKEEYDNNPNEMKIRDDELSVARNTIHNLEILNVEFDNKLEILTKEKEELQKEIVAMTIKYDPKYDWDQIIDDSLSAVKKEEQSTASDEIFGNTQTVHAINEMENKVIDKHDKLDFDSTAKLGSLSVIRNPDNENLKLFDIEKKSEPEAAKIKFDHVPLKEVVVRYLSLPSGSSEKEEIFRELASLCHFNASDYQKLGGGKSRGSWWSSTTPAMNDLDGSNDKSAHPRDNKYPQTDMDIIVIKVTVIKYLSAPPNSTERSLVLPVLGSILEFEESDYRQIEGAEKMSSSWW